MEISVCVFVAKGILDKSITNRTIGRSLWVEFPKSKTNLYNQQTASTVARAAAAFAAAATISRAADAVVAASTTILLGLLLILCCYL